MMVKGCHLFGVFDGHGGSRASTYARDYMPTLLKTKLEGEQWPGAKEVHPLLPRLSMLVLLGCAVGWCECRCNLCDGFCFLGGGATCFLACDVDFGDKPPFPHLQLPSCCQHTFVSVADNACRGWHGEQVAEAMSLSFAEIDRK